MASNSLFLHWRPKDKYKKKNDRKKITDRLLGVRPLLNHEIIQHTIHKAIVLVAVVVRRASSAAWKLGREMPCLETAIFR